MSRLHTTKVIVVHVTLGNTKANVHDKDMPTWIINNPDANGNKKGEVFYILGVVLCMPNATKTSISIKLS